jgi:hypothetical protein
VRIAALVLQNQPVTLAGPDRERAGVRERFPVYGPSVETAAAAGNLLKHEVEGVIGLSGGTAGAEHSVIPFRVGGL